MEMKERLFLELKKLSKRANQRILRLERLTGEKETFAVKELMDYLSSVNAVTKSGRVRYAMSMTETELTGAIKKTKEFLFEKQYTTTREVKKLKAEIEKSIGVELKYKDISTFYTASKLWKWVDKNFDSNFWTDFAPLIFEESKSSWVELVINHSQIKDSDVRNKLKAIYDYIKTHGLNGVYRID